MSKNALVAFAVVMALACGKNPSGGTAGLDGTPGSGASGGDGATDGTGGAAGEAGGSGGAGTGGLGGSGAYGGDGEQGGFGGTGGAGGGGTGNGTYEISTSIGTLMGNVGAKFFRDRNPASAGNVILPYFDTTDDRTLRFAVSTGNGETWSTIVPDKVTQPRAVTEIAHSVCQDSVDWNIHLHFAHDAAQYYARFRPSYDGSGNITGFSREALLLLASNHIDHLSPTSITEVLDGRGAKRLALVYTSAQPSLYRRVELRVTTLSRGVAPSAPADFVAVDHAAGATVVDDSATYAAGARSGLLGFVPENSLTWANELIVVVADNRLQTTKFQRFTPDFSGTWTAHTVVSMGTLKRDPTANAYNICEDLVGKGSGGRVILAWLDASDVVHLSTFGGSGEYQLDGETPPSPTGTLRYFDISAHGRDLLFTYGPGRYFLKSGSSWDNGNGPFYPPGTEGIYNGPVSIKWGVLRNGGFAIVRTVRPSTTLFDNLGPTEDEGASAAQP